MTTYAHPTGYYRYRYFNLTGQLLYVGSTCRLSQRRANHARRSHWWSEVDHERTLVDEYDTRQECADAERDCYERDHPLYNVKTPGYYGASGPRSRTEPNYADERDWCATLEARRLSREGVPFPEWDVIDLDDYDDAYYAEVAANQAAIDAHVARCRAEARELAKPRTAAFIPAAWWAGT